MPEQEKETQNQEWAQSNPAISDELGQDGIPHAELVEHFRGAIAKEFQRYRGTWTPEEIVHARLNASEEKLYYPLARAFDAVAYERYEQHSTARSHALGDLWLYCADGTTSTVKLTDPVEVRIMDALTEALGIPYEKGQTEIPIPAKLQDAQSYLDSEEYAHLLAKAEAIRRAREG